MISVARCARSVLGNHSKIIGGSVNSDVRTNARPKVLDSLIDTFAQSPHAAKDLQ